MSFTNGTIGEIIKVLDMAGVEMLAISLPDSRIVDVTKSLASHWQCSKYEVIGQQLSQTENSPYYAHYVNKEISGVDGQAQMLVEIVKANGASNDKITHQFKPQHHKDGKAEYLLLIGKQSHKAKAEKQDDEYLRLQLAVEASGYVSWEIDFSNYTLNFAPELYEMVGFNNKDITLTLPKWNTLIHPQDVNKSLESIAASASETERFLETRYRVRHKSGSYIWIEIIARLIKDPITRELTRMIGLCREITDEMDERHRIETSEQNLSRSQALANIGSWVMDLKNHTVEWSDNMYALIGVSKGGEPRHNFESLTELMDDLNKGKWQEALEQAKLGHPISNLECVFNVQGEDPQILTVHIDLEYDSDANPAKLHGICQNITEQSMMERKFLQAQKMESVGQLTGGIAHDFNNLLMVVLGNLQLLEKLTKDDNKATTRLNTAIDAVNKGSELTKRLLAFSRQQTLETAAFPVNELVTEMEDMLTRALRGCCDLKIQPGSDIWPVNADKTQLETAILNLAINARDAMGDSGTLVVETANKTLDKAYTKQHEEVTPGDYVMIAVTDTGEGMPPEIIDKVLQPFFTTKAVGEGSGLGLSMIYGFVKQSKGHLAIYSEVGHGTTIRIYLPRCVEEIQDTSAESNNVNIEVSDDNTIEQVQETTISSPAPVFTQEIIENIPVTEQSKQIEQSSSEQAAGVETKPQVDPEVETKFDNTPEHPVEPTSQVTAEPTMKTPIVLIAEDNDPVRDVAVAMIEDMGYIVLDAPNGDKALDIIKQRDDIDLLLSDVVMPGMNGPELAAEALKIRPDLKVLFASGYTQGTAEDMHELPNFIELIDKPFTQKDLTDKVRAAVEGQLKKDAA